MRVVTSLETDNWRAVPEAARAAEAAGYDGLVAAEIKHDIFMPLALAATATSRIQLATGIAVAFPRSPMVTAGQSWDLQDQSSGRFALGLGTQVKGHNERRFSTPWGPPVQRMREYVQSLRAIWRCWAEGAPLEFKGEHYNFTLMTPEFSPARNGLPPVPVTIAAVGPDMLRMAGRICDGVRLHGFCTRGYMEQQVLARVGEGLERAGRRRENLEIIGGGFIATGPDEATVRERMDWVRYRVAFYGSTRTYFPVLAVHGLEDLGLKLHRMSTEGKWSEMAKEVSDDVVRLFAAIGTYDEIVDAIAARFGGISDTVNLTLPPGTEPERVRALVAGVKAIPMRFQGYAAVSGAPEPSPA